MTESVARYEAWERELKAQLAAYVRLRKQVRYFPLFGVVTAPLGFFWAPWLAVSIFFAWVAIWGTTLYITYMRTWQYKNELAQNRIDMAEVRRLEASRSP